MDIYTWDSNLVCDKNMHIYREKDRKYVIRGRGEPFEKNESRRVSASI